MLLAVYAGGSSVLINRRRDHIPGQDYRRAGFFCCSTTGGGCGRGELTLFWGDIFCPPMAYGHRFPEALFSREKLLGHSVREIAQAAQ